MKITRYKTFLVDAHRMNFIFFKLYTDTGHEGLGEATHEQAKPNEADAKEMKGSDYRKNRIDGR